MNKNILWLKKVDSTNKYSIKNYHLLSNHSLVIAGEQTNGLGRHGKPWLSPPGVNLYATYIIKEPGFNILKTSWIGGLAALYTVRKTAQELDFWLKWPNDIYCRNKKIAGVLCESVMNNTGKIDGVVIGIGININTDPEYLTEIDRPATSILAETNRKLSISDIAELLLNNLIEIEKLAVAKGEDSLFRIWKTENKLIGKKVNITLNGNKTLEVKIIDIKNTGQLYVIDQESNFHEIYSGEVSINGFE